jgi:hypothetical protein
MTSEPLPEAVGCEQLTDALRRSGALGDGRVSDVAIVSSRTTILSQIIRLRLSYDGPAPNAPSSVIFKTGHPDRAGSGWSGGHQEVAFYWDPYYRRYYAC